MARLGTQMTVPAVSPIRQQTSVMAGGVVAVLGAMAAWRLWGDDAWLALVITCGVPVLTVLTVIDVREHKLPNRYTYPLVCAVSACCLADAAARQDGRLIRDVFIGALALGLVYLGLVLLGGGAGMGLGDAKLAPTLGGLAAWHSPDAWLAALTLPFLIGGVVGVVALARGGGRQARIPFGPCMIAGTLVGLLLAAG